MCSILNNASFLFAVMWLCVRSRANFHIKLPPLLCEYVSVLLGFTGIFAIVGFGAIVCVCDACKLV